MMPVLCATLPPRMPTMPAATRLAVAARSGGAHLGAMRVALGRALVRGLHWLSELRIDVDVPGAVIEQDLARLQQRLTATDGSAPACEELPLSCHGLVFRTREADGEQFVYVLDPKLDRLVAYVVFSRLIEVNRWADPHLRSPHSKVAQTHQRMGIATTIYRWWLDGGRNLMTGARQSEHANRLWAALAKDYDQRFVRIIRKRVHSLGAAVSQAQLDSLETRMVLLGRGCALEAFASS